MRVAVVQAPTGSAALHELHRAVPVGVSIQLVLTDAVAASAPGLVAAAERLFPTVVVNDDPMQVDLGDWDAVVTFADPMLEYTDVLRERLGARGCLPGAWRKDRQRRLLVDAGLSTLGTASASTPAELIEAASRLRLPLVVKPVRGAGGAAVRLVRTADDMRRLASTVGSGRWQVEEVVADAAHPSPHQWLGHLVSVEVATDAMGCHTPVATFGKFPIQTVSVADTEAPGETLRVCGDVLPSGLPEDVTAAVHTLVINALDVLEVRSRVTHTEILLGPDGPEVVEVNGRVGGFLNRVLAGAGGADLVGSCLSVAAGNAHDLPRHAGTYGAAAGFFPSFTSLEGEVKSAGPGKRDLLAIDGVVAVAGVARQGQTYRDIDARMANIVMAAADLESLGGVHARVVSSLEQWYAEDGGLRHTWTAASLTAAD